MAFLKGFATVLTIAVFAWCFVILSVFLFGRVDEARAVDTIVVLGAAQYDGRPSPVLKARLDHAIELYHGGYAPRLIVTGGVGVGDTVSEAEVSRRYAARAGVDPEHILLERGGLSTAESMAAVSQLMRSNELRSALLVSDPFHMFRLRLLSMRLGLRAYSSPTRSSPIGVGSDDEWEYVLRESLILPGLLLGERRPRFGPPSSRPD